MTVKLYVEGGGNRNDKLQGECRRGFSELLSKSGLKGRMPRIVACGARKQALSYFQRSLSNGQDLYPVLLVDSEAPIATNDPWKHVAEREGDQWVRPSEARNDQLHLMVQTMEAWFHADKAAVAKVIGPGCREARMSPRPDVENIPKSDLFDSLKRATDGKYSKGANSFQILAELDPAIVEAASPWAKRFFDTMRQLCHPPESRR